MSRKVIVFSGLVLILLAAVAYASPRFPVFESPPIVSTGVVEADTVILLGGPYRKDGKFESDDGLRIPDFEGWTGVDLTASDASKWHVDVFNSPTVTPAMWCGDVFASCGEDDPAEGYGNSYEEYLDWTGTVDDPGVATSVTVSFALNYDNEPGYDYLYLLHEGAADWRVQGTYNGSNYDEGAGAFVPLSESLTFTVPASDLHGDDGDEVHLRFRAASDGGWSDDDCLWPTAGLAQIDDIAVSGDNGLPSTFDDFDGAKPLVNWVPSVDVGVGDFAKVWPLLRALDETCGRNATPQVAFIDDGVVEPCTGGTRGDTWTYGPGGYVVNLTGGCRGLDGHLMNEVWSPPIAWADGDGHPLGVSHTGGLLEYDVYEHLPLVNGIFSVWRVRSSIDGGATWTMWANRNFTYFPLHFEHVRKSHEITWFLPDDPTHVQIALGAHEIGWIWGLEATDGTPAPYYDNVCLKAFRIDGPRIRTREQEQAQDAFPTNGTLDLVDLGNNSIRFDMAYDVVGDMAPIIIPGDSVVFDVNVIRNGATLTGLPQMHWAVRRNPLFDPHRAATAPNPVPGDTVRAANGEVYPERFSFDLPDEGFFFPGDVIHYYIRAEDSAGGDVRAATLPSTLDGFGVFAGDPGYVPDQWPSAFTVRGLPTLTAAAPGAHPPILVYEDDGAEPDPAWRMTLANLGYEDGVHYDRYVTKSASSGVSNGLGSRATSEQIAGYRTILCTTGRSTIFTLTTFDQASDKSDDIALLESWLDRGDRNLLLVGDNLVEDLENNAGAAADVFLADYMGVSYIGHDVVSRLGTPTKPAFAGVPDGPIAFGPDLEAAGGCPSFRGFDAVAPLVPAAAIARWTMADGSVHPGPEVAGLLNVLPTTGSKVVTFPIALDAWLTPEGVVPGDGSVAARTLWVEAILDFFGESGGTPTSVEATPRTLAADCAPNPFNPTTTLRYDVPQRGRVTVEIFDVRGARVRTLVDAVHEPGAGYATTWHGRDDDGAAVGSGAYFARARQSGEAVVVKMMLVR